MQAEVVTRLTRQSKNNLKVRDRRKWSDQMYSLTCRFATPLLTNIDNLAVR